MGLDHAYTLIFAGGAGTRLWPLSRKKQPKQFQAFTTQQTLLQTMVGLATQTVPIGRVLVMSIPEFREEVARQLPQLPSENILSDPARRDTGPALALGMLQIRQRDPQAIVACLWSDHLIQEPAAFATALAAAFEVAADFPESLVTVGSKPTHPDTGLGYIQMGAELGEYRNTPVFRAKQFVEKPDLATATRFVSSWEYLWNSGYQIMGAEPFRTAFRQVQPELVPVLDRLEQACLAGDQNQIQAAYLEMPKLSIDYLFTQKMKELIVVPADMGWSDIGNWTTLHDVLKQNQPDGLVTQGAVFTWESHDCLVYAKDRPIATVGLKDVVVVDSGDVILVMAKERAQSLKGLIQTIEQHNPELL